MCEILGLYKIKSKVIYKIHKYICTYKQLFDHKYIKKSINLTMAMIKWHDNGQYTLNVSIILCEISTAWAASWEIGATMWYTYEYAMLWHECKF